MAFIGNAAAPDGTAALDTILAQQANVIGKQVYQNTLHVSPWLDLMPQTAFPEGLSYQLTTLVYDRSIPTRDTAGNSAGMYWSDLATLQGSNQFDTRVKEGSQPLADATNQTAGPFGGDTDGDGDITDDARSYIRFSKQLKPYNLNRATIESPKISLEDLMFAVHRDQQLNAITEVMTESVRYSWENRNRDEYMRVSGNLVSCQNVDGGSEIHSDFEGFSLGDSNGSTGLTLATDLGSAVTAPDANISNALLDRLYNKMNRQGAGNEAYGRENGRPVYALILSSVASYKLMTESEIRTDVRESSRVSELIAPLGVEKAFRGYYHLVDDLTPRYKIDTGVLVRTLPYTVTAGIMDDNADYDDTTEAPLEAAFIVHPHVCECQVPNPFRGARGITFDPVSFRGDFRWTNNKHDVTNPDGLIGYFRAILACATKPIKTQFGYTILFNRTVDDLADVTPA